MSGSPVLTLAGRPFPYTCFFVRQPARLVVLAILAFALGYAVLVPGAVRAVDGHWEARAMVYLLLAALVCVTPMIPFGSGYENVLPNRVVVVRGVTWIPQKLLPVDQLSMFGSLVVLALMGAFYVAWSATHAVELIAYPAWNWSAFIELVAVSMTFPAGLSVLIFAIWGAGRIVIHQPRSITMTPDGITYRRIRGSITLSWDDLGDSTPFNDIRQFERQSRFALLVDRLGRSVRWGVRDDFEYFFPGAKITVHPAHLEGTELPVHWDNEHTPRLLLETGHFTVEPSALLTAILALRDNPELRPLLGTRDSKVLFKGPPWRVRRHMYRTQQWWPKGAAPDGIAVDRDGVVKEFQ